MERGGMFEKQIVDLMNPQVTQEEATLENDADQADGEQEPQPESYDAADIRAQLDDLQKTLDETGTIDLESFQHATENVWKMIPKEKLTKGKYYQDTDAYGRKIRIFYNEEEECYGIKFEDPDGKATHYEINDSTGEVTQHEFDNDVQRAMAAAGIDPEADPNAAEAFKKEHEQTRKALSHSGRMGTTGSDMGRFGSSVFNTTSHGSDGAGVFGPAEGLIGSIIGVLDKVTGAGQ